MGYNHAYTQFCIRRWERLHAEAVTHWEECNKSIQEQADKATAVDDGLINSNENLDISKVVRPNTLTSNGSGKTTEVSLGNGAIVKVPIDENGEIEGADKFRNNTRSLPLKVLAIRKAIYDAPRSNLNMPQKSW